MDLRTRLRATRLARGLTHQQAAAAIGIPLRTYQEWEAGRGAQSVLDRVALLARWLGEPIVISEDDIPTEPDRYLDDSTPAEP